MRLSSVPLPSLFHVSIFFRFNQKRVSTHCGFQNFSPISQISPSPPCLPPPTGNSTHLPTLTPLALSWSPSKQADRPAYRKSDPADHRPQTNGAHDRAPLSNPADRAPSLSTADLRLYGHSLSLSLSAYLLSRKSAVYLFPLSFSEKILSFYP